MDVSLVVRGVRVPGGRVPFERTLRRLGMLAAAGAGRDVALAYVLVGNDEMRAVHKRSLGLDTPTDVLSFPYASEPRIEGEIVVSVDVARAEAKRRGHAAEAEAMLYAVHGTLHLLGYDDHAPRDRTRMRAAERRFLRRLGYPPVFGPARGCGPAGPPR